MRDGREGVGPNRCFPTPLNQRASGGLGGGAVLVLVPLPLLNSVVARDDNLDYNGRVGWQAEAVRGEVRLVLLIELLGSWP